MRLAAGSQTGGKIWYLRGKELDFGGWRLRVCSGGVRSWVLHQNGGGRRRFFANLEGGGEKGRKEEVKERGEMLGKNHLTIKKWWGK